MDVVVKRKVPYFGLKVPQQYKLNGYKSVNVQEASSGYVPIKLPKPLRTGAEVKHTVLILNFHIYDQDWLLMINPQIILI